jgi:hypothetical protein
MAINEERQLGRAKNAVLSFLEQRLSIPKIYIDADWDGHHVDVLAINRDGVGDVHAVLLFTREYFSDGGLNTLGQAEAVVTLIDRFASIPAQYKYIAALDPSQQNAPFRLSDVVIEKTFAPDGIGRIGFLKIEVPADGDPQTKVEIKPERFRAAVAKLADEYVQKHEADWEIRA